MPEGIIARFTLHLMCGNCSKIQTQNVDVRNAPGAPTTVNDLNESGLLEKVSFVCRDCECPSGSIQAVTAYRKANPGKTDKERPRLRRYVVAGYERRQDRWSQPLAPFEVRSEEAARRVAKEIAEKFGGALATVQAGDPELDDWETPELLLHVGKVPRHALTDFRVE
ncbi:hypothetical protein [Methylopila sp. 73B]|uniref:hypothetical protein n=1 Tax=Methylopila sp. 73B TaxID=1120792 RepID=UPI0003817643|nr:hypothetical protein [Methylopila sp. 73B]